MVVYLIALVFTIFLTKILTTEATDPVVVITKNGPYRSDPRWGHHVFEGMRYAAPPLGDLRFADPVPYTELHTEVWNATKPGSECIQKHETKSLVHGSEDCLFVNVYAQKPYREAMLPVVVHIHGGGFIYGAGSDYGPGQLLNRKVVFVTFNYRLGIMGFLSAGATGMTGNMGLKDQVVALEWIQENIKAFGGDPDNVTIVGWSAGAAGVQFHYISPMSERLFARGIAHSGSMFNHWAWQSSPEWRFNVVSLKVGCVLDEYPFTKRIQCLKNVPAEKLVELTTDPLFQPFEGNPFNPFGVVLERGSNAFIREYPEETIAKGQVQKLPLIISGVRNEGYYPGAEFLANPEIFAQIDAQFDEVLSSILHFPAFSDTKNQALGITKGIRARYLGKVPVREETFEYFVKILTDYLYLTGFQQAIDQLSPITTTYVYGFDYKTAYGFGEAISHRNHTKGIAHGEDIVLIYDTDIRHDRPFTLEEQDVMSQLLDIYESFAYTGVPEIRGMRLKPTNSTTAITFTHIKGPHNFSSVTTNLDRFTDKAFWNRIQFMLDEPLASCSSSLSLSLFGILTFGFFSRFSYKTFP